MLTFPTIRLFGLATGLLVSVVVALLTLAGIAHAQPVPPHVVVGQVFDNQQLLGSGTVRAYLGEQLVGTGTGEKTAPIPGSAMSLHQQSGTSVPKELSVDDLGGYEKEGTHRGF